MLLRLLPPFLASLASLAFAWSAAADCQPAGPLEEELRIAPVVFVGTVVAVEGGSARFSVEEVWAGRVGPQVDVRGLGGWATFGDDPTRRRPPPVEPFPPVGLALDDRVWEIGARYLVIPTIDGEILTDHQCNATIEWRAELAEFRPGAASVHPVTQGIGIPLPLLVAGVAILLLGIGSAIAFRQR